LTAEPDRLAESHRLAVAFADALMVRPGDLDDATVAALRATYTPEQLVELTLKVLKFNTQKLNVTLGTHRWFTADDLAAARWNQDGAFVAVERSAD
jgi:alkylhydroperoxidase family enzyme